MKLHCFHVLIFTGLLFVSQQVTVAAPIGNLTESRKVVKTGKERLGKKASDDQRVNNCKVLVEDRGSRVRPDHCQWLKP